MPANKATSIEQFINGFNGGTRLNRFAVTTNCEAFGGGYSTGQGLATTTFHIRSAQIPGHAISSIGVNWFGRTVEIPGERVYQPWVITVMDDKGAGFELHSIFQSWQHSIGNMNSHTFVQLANAFQEGSTPNGLGCQWLIEQFRTDSDEIEKDFILYNAWPIQVGPIELDQSKDNVLAQFSVTLAYSHFV